MYDLSARNPLVSVNFNKLWCIDSSTNNADRIYKKQQFYKKEYGLQTVLLVSHFIKWKAITKNVFYISPLIYRSVNISKNQKISLNYEYDFEDKNHQINTIISTEFKKQFDVNLQIKDNDSFRFIEDLKELFESNGDKIESVDSFNSTNEWQIITVNAIGNFNYKKSVLGKDYDIISNTPNESVASILGEGNTPIVNEIIDLDLPNSDNSQKSAIRKAMVSNLVIQGPPGTGKSHTIVELIKQNLVEGKKVLFVSEKKSALDVVYEKLKTENLDHLTAYFNGSKSQKKEFYANLKLAIKQFDILNNETDTSNNTDLDTYFNDYSTVLTAHNEKLGTQLIELLTYLARHQVTQIEHTKNKIIPAYKLWQNYLEFIEDIENISTSKFNMTAIGNLPFLHFNKAVFLDSNPLLKIDKRLSELELHLVKVKAVLSQFNLSWDWKMLSKHCLSATVLNMANTSQLDILDPKSKKYKSFDIWTKKYELTQNKLKNVTELCSKWKTKPNLAEIDELIDKLNQKQNKSWLSFFKKSKINIAFTNYNGDLSNELKLKSLQNLKNYYELSSTVKEIEIKLKHNLNVLNPTTDINHLLHLRQKLQSLSTNEYVFLLEQDNSLELIEALHKLHPQILQSNQIVNYIFNDYSIHNIDELITKINHIKTYNSLYTYYLPEIKKTLNLPAELLFYIKSNPKSVRGMTDEVVYFAYQNEVKYNYTLKNLNAKDFERNFKALKNQKTVKTYQKTNKISKLWVNNWKNIEELLITPASKLKGTDKDKKQKYKVAKRTIFHEIVKKQQHLPIKQLVEQTDYSIFDIQPLWIMNPLSIAENLPCDADLFDLIIFDEASQIPLEDAIPAIYRAKQVVVVGDSKQMPPSQFFSSSSETVTLLNQAESVFKSHLLTWHYRSQHPRLIQFSNHHFYDNELNYFPSISKQNPISSILVKNGLFEEGSNKNEAKIVAQTYQKQLQKGIKSIGVIAFSKSQEQEIKNEINILNLTKNTDLLIRNLENSQGIEKDVIIISVGYGFNSEGNFRMNFGPLNQEYGANRLNVLLTRAKQNMIVVTSVTSTDFKLTENRGVTLLHQFLKFAEQQGDTKMQSIPTHFLHSEIDKLLTTYKMDANFYSATNGLAVNCFIQHSTHKILLIDPSLNAKENTDIFTLLSVIYSRFKHVKIVFSTDYLENKNRFKKEIIKFFN